MEERFKKIRDEFLALRKDYQKKKLTEREFKDRLKELRLTDRNGRCWTIGAKTGKWYYYDGNDWVEAQPPSLQQGKAICIYCGYENDVSNEACDYCGGSLEGEEVRCPECGCELSSSSQQCPECSAAIPTQAFKQAAEEAEGRDAVESLRLDEADIDVEAKQQEVSRLFDQFQETERELEPFEGIFPDEGGPNAVLTSVSPWSLLMFMGILGTIVGLILGVFVGISTFFMGIVRSLPPGIQSMHGSLFGGVVYGLLGGVFGFAALGAFGLIVGLLTNLVLSFFGGIKYRVDRMP